MHADLRFITNVDQNGHINYINPEYQQWIGYSLSELIGQPSQVLRSADTPSLIQETILNECHQNRPVSFMIEEQKKSGERYWVEISIQPKFEQEQYQGYVSTKRLIEDPIVQQQAATLYAQIAQDNVVFYNGEWVSKRKHGLLSILGLHKASLSQKVLVTLSLISTIIVGSAFVYEQTEKDNIRTHATESHQQTIANTIDQLITKKAEIGLTNAIGIVHSPEIHQAIVNENTAQLSALLSTVADEYRQLSDLKNIKLHFTNENMQSFFKSWLPLNKQKISDLSNRGYLKTIAQEQKPMVAYAVSSAGFNIKSIMPIFENQRYEGAVEFIQGVGSIRRDFGLKNQQYLLAISTEYALSGDEFRAKNANNIPISNDKAWVVGNNKQFSMENSGKHIELLRSIDLNRLFEQGYLVTSTHFHVAKPQYDNSQKRIGFHIVTEDIAQYQADIEQQLAVAESVFYGILISVIVLMILVTALLWILIIIPIRNTQHTMEQAVKDSDLFTRIHTYGNDEIKQMAQAYNRQSTMAQIAISEINTAMEEIVAGRLDYQITFPFQSDFGMLKERINQTSQSLNTTFGNIAQLMQDLQQGQFDKPHQHELQGAYAQVVDDCVSAMQRLSAVFSEINQVMSFAARGKFDERIQDFSEGNIKTLQVTINDSLELIQSGFSDIVAAASRMAKGNLSQPMSHQYEFTLEEAKQAINGSIEGLNAALSQIKDVSLQVSEGVQSVAEGTQNLNQRTQEQAASLEETSSAMEQTTAQIRSNLDNTQIARQIAQNQSGVLQEANGVMQETKTSMSNIQTASDQIKEITAIIDSIAFQTNLLALNAAVEAARAGEHGRGFAVVAGEVRNLAGKSADAAKQIGTLVEQTSGAIRIGVNQVDKVGSSLEEITVETQKMLDIVSEVFQASQEQAHGVDEVNKAITQIDGVTQQNAALVEETTATTETLLDSVETLQSAVSSFELQRKLH